MNLIACVDKNWAIGNKGELLVSIPSDKKLFKELTDGKVVIGGEKVYKEFMPYCSRAYITKVDYEYEADAYLEDLEKSDEWIMTHDSDEWTYYDLEYYFYQYKRK